MSEQRLYRGKRVDNEPIAGCVFHGNWAYGYYFHRESDGKSFIIFSHPGHLSKLIVMTVEVHPASVGQSTGLKDKEGVDLDWWEGDLFNWAGSPMKIIFEEGAFWLQSIEDPSEWNPLYEIGATPPDDLKKIGTIHDNPELVKETEQ